MRSFMGFLWRVLKLCPAKHCVHFWPPSINLSYLPARNFEVFNQVDQDVQCIDPSIKFLGFMVLKTQSYVADLFLEGIVTLVLYIYSGLCHTNYNLPRYTVLRDDGSVINQSSILETSRIRGRCAKIPIIILMMILQIVIALHTCGIARLVDDLL